jgi:hypothetical protein
MTPEHTFILWTTALTALPAIVIAGVVAFWTWRRDQERIIVQKSPVRMQTLDETETAVTGVGIAVTNLSLFPVRIAGLGFRLDGKTVFYFDRSKHETEWPTEIPSRARIAVYANFDEWKQIQALGLRDRIMDWAFVAAARTETSLVFSSNRLSVWILRPYRAFGSWINKKRGLWGFKVTPQK